MESTQAAAGGYCSVVTDELPTVPHNFPWIRRSRWARRAVGAAFCAPLVAIALLGSRHSAPLFASTDTAGEALQGKAAVAPEVFTCAKYGCLDVKVLSYNPEWWHVIEQMGGNGNSIAKVIVQGSQGEPFDFIGFQEFYDPWYGLTRPGFDATRLLSQYMFVRGEFGGPVGTIIAFHNATWALLARGQRYVGEDRKGPVYFGKRIALWARFQHKQTGKTVFMMNHHGPLPTNTGGVCGPMTTALNLLHVITEHAKFGDAVVFVGDFNANIASVTVKKLSMHLHRLFQGIDNIFVNLPPANVVRPHSLPSGGSDHAAITALLELPGGAGAPAAAQVL